MSDNLEQIARAVAKELERQANEDRAGTPWVDADDLSEANIDGRVNLKLVAKAALNELRAIIEARQSGADLAAERGDSAQAGIAASSMEDMIALLDDVLSENA